MKIKRLGVWSVAKLSALLYAFMGVIIGAFVTLFVLLPVSAAENQFYSARLR